MEGGVGGGGEGGGGWRGSERVEVPNVSESEANIGIWLLVPPSRTVLIGVFIRHRN